MKNMVNMGSKQQRVIMVLGMHRSGTSAITRGLQVLGVSLGDKLIPPIANVNEKGFWEDIDLVALDDKILKAIRSDWFCLTPVAASNLQELREQGHILRAVELLKEKIKHRNIFAFKDPRVAKLLPFWNEVTDHLQLDVNYLIAMRHPLSVVKSLEKRDSLAPEWSYLLWLGHVLESLRGSTGKTRIVVDYDRMMQSPDKELSRIASALNLQLNTEELAEYKNKFLDAALRHTAYSPNDMLLDAACPPIVHEVFNRLLNVASDQISLDDPTLVSEIAEWSIEFDRLKTSFRLADKQYIQIANLSKAVTERDSQLACLNRELIDRDTKLTSLTQTITERDAKAVRVEKELFEVVGKLRTEEVIRQQAQARFEAVLRSKSWRLTRPLRFAGCLARGQFATAFAPIGRSDAIKDCLIQLRRVKNAFGYVARGDWVGLGNRIALHRRQSVLMTMHKHHAQSDSMTWGIITPGHTLFVGHLVAERLSARGWGVEIMTQPPVNFHHDFYIVICPQVFDRLPPSEKRIAFQMEQSVSSRWFTDEYFKVLENSLAVLEYSLENIEFLAAKGIAYPHVYYLPIGTSNTYGSDVEVESKKYDVLFYGDCYSSPRRQLMLDALKKRFDVHIASEVFGEGMIQILKESRVVVNLHYYENALLEMPRIQECLSLGVHVVSESARDQGDYPELEGAVTYFAEGSIEEMLSAVECALRTKVRNQDLVMRKSKDRFAFMFDRFLLGMGFISSTNAKDMSLPLPEGVRTFALSLPETISRRRIFEAIRPDDCAIFDGIRLRPGWIGCGLSYAAVARNALDKGLKSIVIMEDDAVLPSDYKETLDIIEKFLDERRGQWDIFSGVIASLHPETMILSVEEFCGRTFVTIDKMISMVFNIYSESALNIMLDWNPEDTNAESNTIDKFLESQKTIRVVVMLPFFVGHREEVHSTLWGFQNTRYSDMIEESQAALREKVAAYLACNNQSRYSQPN